MDLFAEQGYDRTTVGQIQEAAGLTFGSGALYKHFPSKEAVLAEGVESFVQSARHERGLLKALDGVPILDALIAIGREAMTSFERDSTALRVAWRDLGGFPELQEKVRTERIRATFDDFTAWLTHQAELGRVGEHDSQAVAAVTLSSLVFFQLLKHLMHDTPGGVNEERFVQTWAQLTLDAVSQSSPPARSVLGGPQ